MKPLPYVGLLVICICCLVAPVKAQSLGKAGSKAAVEQRAAAQRAAQEKAQRLAREKAEREARAAAERQAREKREREQRAAAEREARAQREREQRAAAEREARAQREREQRAAAEREARAQREREQRAAAEREARAEREREQRAAAEREARAQREREQRAAAEREARAEREREQRAAAEREARAQREREQRAAAEHEARAEREREQRAAAEREARAQREREQRAAAEREARAEREREQRAAAEREARAEREREKRAAAEREARAEREREQRAAAEREARAQREREQQTRTIATTPKTPTGTKPIVRPRTPTGSPGAERPVAQQPATSLSATSSNGASRGEVKQATSPSRGEVETETITSRGNVKAETATTKPRTVAPFKPATTVATPPPSQMPATTSSFWTKPTQASSATVPAVKRPTAATLSPAQPNAGVNATPSQAPAQFGGSTPAASPPTASRPRPTQLAPPVEAPAIPLPPRPTEDMRDPQTIVSTLPTPPVATATPGSATPRNFPNPVNLPPVATYTEGEDIVPYNVIFGVNEIYECLEEYYFEDTWTDYSYCYTYSQNLSVLYDYLSYIDLNYSYYDLSACWNWYNFYADTYYYYYYQEDGFVGPPNWAASICIYLPQKQDLLPKVFPLLPPYPENDTIWVDTTFGPAAGGFLYYQAVREFDPEDVRRQLAFIEASGTVLECHQALYALQCLWRNFANSRFVNLLRWKIGRDLEYGLQAPDRETALDYLYNAYYLSTAVLLMWPEQRDIEQLLGRITMGFRRYGMGFG